ncbi:hypothetical protein J5J84_09065 [Alcaligenes faecalis]|nr:hypothetical protein J5J84_09065 [Alcaligenes faecalis]
MLSLSKFPSLQTGNIEALISYCKIAEDFIDDVESKDKIRRFIEIAEQTVRDEVHFLNVDDDVSIHADFLRRLVRRSTRKLRSKIFITNYDLCFEYAARKGRYVVIDVFSHSTPQVFDSLFLIMTFSNTIAILVVTISFQTYFIYINYMDLLIRLATHR